MKRGNLFQTICTVYCAILLHGERMKHSLLSRKFKVEFTVDSFSFNMYFMVCCGNFLWKFIYWLNSRCHFSRVTRVYLVEVNTLRLMARKQSFVYHWDKHKWKIAWKKLLVCCCDSCPKMVTVTFHILGIFFSLLLFNVWFFKIYTNINWNLTTCQDSPICCVHAHLWQFF